MAMWDAPTNTFMTPEQQRYAQAMGFFGAADNLANMSAPHPLSQGGQPTLLQMVTGGLKGYMGGANQYQTMLADQYKNNTAIQDDQKLRSWGDTATPEQAKTMEGLPMTPDIIKEKLKIKQQQGGVVDYQVQKVMAENPNLNYTQALQLVQTGWRQGIGITPTGDAQVIPNMPNAKGAIKQGENYGGASGTNAADLYGKPLIAKDVAIATKIGETQGLADSGLSENLAYYPEVLKTVEDLRALAKDATYTSVGKVYDVVQKEVGLGATKGAVARTKYEDTVRDNLLPLLRQTFGAQFTENEGKTLMATMGDPDKTPEQKQASLDAFVTSKQRQINAKQRQTGKDLTDFTTPDGIRVQGVANPAGNLTANPQQFGIPPLGNSQSFDIDSFLKSKGMK